MKKIGTHSHNILDFVHNPHTGDIFQCEKCNKYFLVTKKSDITVCWVQISRWKARRLLKKGQ